MKLSDLSIKNPVFAWMLMFALMLFGAIGFSRMGVSQMPDVDFPVLNVRVTWEGAAPEVVEANVVDVLEDAIMSVEGIREVSSSSRQGNASLTIEFELNRDIDAALQEVQTKVAQAQRRLPRDIDPPVITKSNPEDQPIVWISLSGDRPVKDLMLYADEHLREKFQTIPGVGEVFMGGFTARNLRVWVNADKLSAKEMTVDDILSAVANQHAEVPAGIMDTGPQELNVRSMGEAASVQEFRKLILTQRGGSPVYVPIKLGDVAEVEDGLDDMRRISRAMGKTAVGLGIRKQRGSNAVAVADRVIARMNELRPQLPQGLELEVNFDSTKFIKDAVHELNFTLVLSALLTSLVCWAFLGSWSSTVNVLLAIPTSVLGTFIVLYFLGFTLNIFTLLGLSLAIGVVVDDAIMMLENIVRHRERGQERVSAAVYGAREISFAAMAATAAVVAIFAPVAFMKGIIGKFFFQFGVTISVAVLLSLLEALTLTPMRCSQFLNVRPRTTWFGHGVEAAFLWLARRYREVLEICLRWRWTVILLSVLFFSASLYVYKGIPKEFVPAQDQSLFLVRLQTPVGSSLEFTDDRFKKAEAYLAARPEVRRYFGSVGGFGGGEVNSGIIFVTMREPKDRPRNPETGEPVTQQELMTLCRKALNAIPDVRAVIQDPSTRGFTAQRGFPVEFTIRGPDWAVLADSVKKVMDRMEASGLMLDVDTDYKVGQPELRIYPNRAAAAARGVDVAAIGRTINALIGGVRAGQFTESGKRYDIRVRLVPSERSRPEDINRLYVRNNHGERIRLSELVRLEQTPTLQNITRRQRERAIGVFANVAPGKSQEKALAEVEKIGKEVLPDGYHVVMGGGAKTFQESFQSLFFALWLGVIVAYMVLGSQFNSFLHPFTVLLALPFSATGALLALRLAGLSFNIYSMIGFILLMGIVKKNSILLVDFTNQVRARGKDVHGALLTACPIRLRPILMTSLSTIAAAVPPALALGPGAETRVPMAVAVIGGVCVSTLLTLFVVPCAYSLLIPIERRHPHNILETLEPLLEEHDPPPQAPPTGRRPPDGR
ncbi:MAG TPA: efflux RND transporter permease subunit [Elusimicrobiota bacterium]|nr:efflux RND transporter permease subunit [Elusimicrobiota bacterium]